MNYGKAACTVIHDRYLLNYECADDDSPCVALVFSPWFIRGWTALELIMSKMIKVPFKGPNELEPVIKDLDEDLWYTIQADAAAPTGLCQPSSVDSASPS
jgi:hypothetical protein